jgi:hypothetical protein
VERGRESRDEAVEDTPGSASYAALTSDDPSPRAVDEKYFEV